MAFGINYESIPQGGQIVPEGDYECIITNAEIRETQNHKAKVALTLTVRNDVAQECKNRFLFMDIWRKKSPTAADEQVDGFNFGQLMAVAKSVRIPSGQTFDSLEMFLRALVGRCLIATVAHEEYNGKTVVRIDPLDTAPTAFPECRHVQKTAQKRASDTVQTAPPRPAVPVNPPASADGFEEILSDGELPF